MRNTNSIVCKHRAPPAGQPPPPLWHLRSGSTQRASRWRLKGNLCLEKNAISATPPRESAWPLHFWRRVVGIKVPPQLMSSNTQPPSKLKMPPQLMTAKAGRVAFWIYYICIYSWENRHDAPPANDLQHTTASKTPPPATGLVLLGRHIGVWCLQSTTIYIFLWLKQYD